MKNIYYKLIIILVFFNSCSSDFLDRYPLSEITPENSFRTASDLELFTNSFYNDLPGRGGIIESDLLSDNILYNGVPLEQTGQRLIPSTAGSSGWNWSTLRKINTFFKYYQQCDDVNAKKEYSGVASFFRAWFYYNKLKRFGGVPWYDQVIGNQDTDLLQKPRDSREFITTKIIEDLNVAIENLNSKKSSDKVNKWTALALKSRVCLFEGTYRKYRGIAGSEDLLTQAYESARILITEGPYNIYSTGSANTDYRDLFASDNLVTEEVILGRRYSKELNIVNNFNYYFLSATQQDVGLTKSLIDTYLMNTGVAFTSQSGYSTMKFYQETANRDPRLAQTIRTPGYKRIGGDGTSQLPNFAASISGYQICKYVANVTQDGDQAGFQDLPIIRLAEVLLNYAEAKAELGLLTQGDLDLSINKLRDRVKMPNLSLVTSNANIDPILQARYTNVTGANTGVILEIRRERRVELALEGFRYDDLMRWKNGKLLEEHFKGMYFSGLGAFDLDNNGTADIELFIGTATTSAPQKIEIGGVFTLSNGTSGNLVPFADRSKSFNEARDYLYPIPSGDILLNPNLVQNPNWGN